MERSQARALAVLQETVRTVKHDLAIAKAEIACQEVQITGLTKACVAHEARWRAEAEIAAIRTLPPEKGR